MIRILFLIVLGFGLVSCGPEMDADAQRDEQREKDRKNDLDRESKLQREKLQGLADQRRSNIENSEGEYLGTYRRGREEIKVRLILLYVDVEYNVPNTAEVVFMPELRGTLRPVTSSNDEGIISYRRFSSNDDASSFRLSTVDELSGVDLRISPNGTLRGRLYTRLIDEPIEFKPNP